MFAILIPEVEPFLCITTIFDKLQATADSHCPVFLQWLVGRIPDFILDNGVFITPFLCLVSAQVAV